MSVNSNLYLENTERIYFQEKSFIESEENYNWIKLSNEINNTISLKMIIPIKNKIKNLQTVKNYIK